MGDYIQVSCPSCNRGIRAPRSAAGRWGKCPSCQNRVYVPTPDDELEEIPLAPLDEDDARAAAEARRVEAELLRQRDAEEAPGAGATSQPAAEKREPNAQRASAAQITDLIIDYLLAMKESDLSRAEGLATRLGDVKAQARSRIQQLMVDAMPPPQLGDIPPALYVGFLKKLEQSLG